MYRKFSNLSLEEKKILYKEMNMLQEVLESLSIQYMISGGTLLGAIRENNFIPWDWDVEYSISCDGNRWRLIQDLKQRGLTVYSTFFAGAPKIVVDSVVLIEIFEFQEGDDGNYHRDHLIYNDNKMVVPSIYMNGVSSFNFNGIETKIPKNSKDYLTYRYGNWNKPKKYNPNDNDHSYLTRDFAPSRIEKIHILLRMLRVFLRKVDKMTMILMDIRLRHKK